MIDVDLHRIEAALAERSVEIGQRADGRFWAVSASRLTGDREIEVRATTLRLLLLGWAHPLAGEGRAEVREDGCFACLACDGDGEVWSDEADGEVRCEACGGDGKDATRGKASVEAAG